jgi:hypothetical protein
MIDFIKIVIRIPYLIKVVWENPLLEFLSEQERRFNDEIRTYHKKTYKGLTFTLFADKMEITGSLHKYFNDGIHNANDFSFLNSILVIYELEKVLNLDLKNCFIVNLEYGLNVLPIMESVKNIVVWLKYHERNEFRYFPELQYAKLAARYSSNGKINWYKVIKGYAKGLQLFDGKTYGDPNLFRIEVKSKRSKYINRFGIYTLQDLTIGDIYLRLGNELLREWDNVLLLDKTLPDAKELSNFKSLDFWENCFNEYRNKFSRQKRKYYSLLSKYPNNLHTQIHNLLESKLKIFEKELRSGAISTAIQDTANKESGAYSIIVKGEFAPKRVCPVTGINISMQKDNSFLLSNTGLKHIKEHNPVLYELLRKRYLPRSGYSGKHTKYEKDEINHLSKQIRNTYYNPQPNVFKDTSQLTLSIIY